MSYNSEASLFHEYGFVPPEKVKKNLDSLHSMGPLFVHKAVEYCLARIEIYDKK